MNRFCLNPELPDNVIKALHLSSPITLTPGTETDLHLRLHNILSNCRVCTISPSWPLSLKGSVDEALMGSTEEVKPQHRIFYFQFYATVLTEESKVKQKKILESFPHFFKWVE
jgi:hypothetical protein